MNSTYIYYAATFYAIPGFYSSEDTCNLNNYDCYIWYESKVHRGHTEQLCHEQFMYKSCKETWDNWHYQWG